VSLDSTVVDTLDITTFTAGTYVSRDTPSLTLGSVNPSVSIGFSCPNLSTGTVNILLDDAQLYIDDEDVCGLPLSA
jgi:hypothetical protein